MSVTIAVAGKGGVGKTTLTSLMIQYLIAHGKKPVLAVDADANSNLNECLNVDVEMTLGEAREKVEHAETNKEDAIPAGMSKSDYMQLLLQDCLAEADDFDLLVMGRTQGKGCYCFVNGLLQQQVAKLTPNYPYVVVDNEAGMEHLSRGILPNIDYLILVSDCSRRGVQAAGRIKDLAAELHLTPKKIGLIINRVPADGPNEGTLEEVKNQGLELLGTVNQNEAVYQYDCDGTPIGQLPADSPVREAVNKIMDNLNV